MGRAARRPPGVWARALSAEIRAAMARPIPAITQRQLATAAGLTPTYLSDRLRDEATLNLDDIEAIAAALDLDPLALMERALRTARQQQPANTDEPRGPLIQSAGTYTAPISEGDAKQLRETRARRSAKSSD